MKKGKKCCWIAKQYKKGWRLGFCYGESDPKYLPFWFDDYKDVLKAHKLNTVLVFMAGHDPADKNN
jgi:hypothetical protein